jgi:hypothetical protein
MLSGEQALDPAGGSWADFQASKRGHEPVLGTKFLATSCLDRNCRGPTRMEIVVVRPEWMQNGLATTSAGSLRESAPGGAWVGRSQRGKS